MSFDIWQEGIFGKKKHGLSFFACVGAKGVLSCLINEGMNMATKPKAKKTKKPAPAKAAAGALGKVEG